MSERSKIICQGEVISWDMHACMSHEPLPLRRLPTLELHLSQHCIHKTAPCSTIKSDLCVRRAASPPRWPSCLVGSSHWKLHKVPSKVAPPPPPPHNWATAGPLLPSPHAQYAPPLNLYHTWSLGRSTCTWITGLETAPVGIPTCPSSALSGRVMCTSISGVFLLGQVCCTLLNAVSSQSDGYHSEGPSNAPYGQYLEFFVSRHSKLNPTEYVFEFESNIIF